MAAEGEPASACTAPGQELKSLIASEGRWNVREADGMFQATVTCAALNAVCVLEASTNLVQWTKLSVKANTTGTMQFDDPGATNRPARFYRVLVR